MVRCNIDWILPGFWRCQTPHREIPRPAQPYLPYPNWQSKPAATKSVAAKPAAAKSAATKSVGTKPAVSQLANHIRRNQIAASKLANQARRSQARFTRVRRSQARLSQIDLDQIWRNRTGFRENRRGRARLTCGGFLGADRQKLRCQ